MNKQDLVNAVAETLGGTKKEASTAVQAVIDGIKSGVMKDGRVGLVGFGTFSTVQRGERTCRNPQTGAEINVPAKMAVKFKVSAVLKDEVASLPLD